MWQPWKQPMSQTLEFMPSLRSYEKHLQTSRFFNTRTYEYWNEVKFAYEYTEIEVTFVSLFSTPFPYFCRVIPH